MTRRVRAALTAIKVMSDDGQATADDVLDATDGEVGWRTVHRALDDVADADLGVIAQQERKKVLRPGRLAGKYLRPAHDRAELREYAGSEDADASADGGASKVASAGPDAGGGEGVDAVTPATAVSALHMPGSGEIEVERRDLMIDVVEYLASEGGIVKPAAIKSEILEPNLDRAGYGTPRSAWKNLVYPALVDLKGAENPGGEGSHGWRWDA
jgi:hypothetical protein